MNKDIHIVIKSNNSIFGDYDNNIHCLITQHDSVLVYDDVANSYTSCHNLSKKDTEEVKHLANLVQSGTHYSSAGFVIKK